VVWAWGRGFAGVEAGQLGVWVAAAAAAAVVDHFTGTPAAKRLAVPGPARTAMVAGALLGAAALGPLGLGLGTVIGALAGLAAGGYGVPGRQGLRRAALGPWLGAMVQAGVTAAMAVWLGVQVFQNGG